MAHTSRLIHTKLDVMTPPGFAILGYSAFVKGKLDWKIVQARKTNETGDISSDAVLAALDMIMERLMPSECQLE